jgi:hypothetical protein
MSRKELRTPCILVLILSILLAILSNCMTVSDTSSGVPSVNSGIDFNNRKIAVLPIKAQTSLAPDSVMPLRVELNKRLGVALKTKLPNAIISDMPYVIDQLNEKGNLNTLEQLFSTYENTGVLDRKYTITLGRALGSDYLLLSRLKAEKLDVGFISKGMGASLELMLVEADTGKTDWSGSGEWKRGGIFGTGNAPPSEAAENLVSLAFSSLQSAGGITRPEIKGTPSSPSPMKTETQKTPEIAPLNKTKSLSIGEIQRRLLELGYKPGPVDGKMGLTTIKALKKFQKNNNLPVTGKADNETIIKLIE